MTATVKEEFRYFNVKNLISSLGGSDTIYLGIGRPYYWNLGSSSDATPDFPKNTVRAVLDDWEDLMSLKRVYQSDISHAIFRETWQANVKYDIYRHDWDGSVSSVYTGANTFDATPDSLHKAKWYTINSNKDVYVCLKQGKVGGVVQNSTYSPETGTPLGTNTGMVKTADGYVWKLIARCSLTDQAKFMTTDYLPIKTLTAAPAPADHYYAQWEAQQASSTFKGGIYNIAILTGGSGYNGGVAGSRNVTNAETDAELKVIGDGTGLQYTVTYTTGGVISDIEITNPGSGYTHASVVATGGLGATFNVFLTKALGMNPVADLNAYYALIGIELNSDEGGDFTVLNDYRKVILVSNPLNYGTTTISTASTLDATTTLNITGESGTFGDDSVITATGGIKGRMVDWNGTTKNLRVIRTKNENGGEVGANNAFAPAQTISASVGGGAGTINTVTNPEIEPRSGIILYSEYRRPIARALAQTENIKIIVEM